VAVGGEAVTWEALAARLGEVRPVTTPKRLSPGWSPIRWRDGVPRRRRSDAVAALSCLVLDFDFDAELADVAAAGAELAGAWVAHTTWSHTPETPRARLVVPLAREVAAERWGEVWTAAARAVSAVAGLTPDPACRDVGRWYLLPGLPHDADAARWRAAGSVRGDGPGLDPVALVRRWHEPNGAAPSPPRPALRGRTTARGGNRDRTRAARLIEARAAMLGAMRPGDPVGRTLWAWVRDAARLERDGLVGAEAVAALAGAARGVLGEAETARVVEAALGGPLTPWTWPD
jgi:hypothetical protein